MSSQQRLKALNILFILILFYTYFYGIGEYGLLTKDEPRYAGSALEMIENNNYIVPKFNFQDRFDKPPLFYWMIVASYKALGVSDFSSRVPSALCAILLILFTWYIAKKILGSTSGFLSAVILATSAEYVFLGRRAATDMALCFFFSSSMYSLYLSYFVKDWKQKIIYAMMSGLFLGLAILTKGPVAILLLFLILTIFLISGKQFDIKHLRVYFIIIFFALLISLPWYIVVHHATCGEFTKVFFLTHNLQRFTSVVGEHRGPIWFYIPVILLGFMPWTLFFIKVLFTFLKHLQKEDFNKLILFCLIWIITIFLFFSFSKTKFATYIILLFPPLALITGHYLNIMSKKRLNFIVCLAFTLVIPGILILKTSLSTYYKTTYADLVNFAKLAKNSGAKEIISLIGYKPILVYYGRVPVNFNKTTKQISKIKLSKKEKKDVFVIGYLSDLNGNKELLKKLKIIQIGKRYFLARIT
ncbi:MAG: glycosyltransferase family 39 protein [Candidatus Melainabacteria bacterium]|nr:glycosyltransferase family 39 protein [Candidatus Melainabacteria bacterium]